MSHQDDLRKAFGTKLRSPFTSDDYNRDVAENLRALQSPMPETPDFEQIAAPLIAKLSDEMDPDNARAFVLDTMRQIWNARGAADMATITVSLLGMTATAARMEPAERVATIEHALRSLDR